MTDTRTWTIFYDDAGELWCVFIDGHQDLSLLQRPEIVVEIRNALFADNGRADHIALVEQPDAIAHHWMRDTTRDHDPDLTEGDIECPYVFCDASAPDAVPVTGVRFC